MTAKNLTVTTALPPRGREEAVLRVAAKYEPSLLRIVTSIPDFRRSSALHEYLLRRYRTLERLAAAAELARTIVSPRTKVETDLVRGDLSTYLASGVGSATAMVVPAGSSVAVAVADRHAVMSS